LQHFSATAYLNVSEEMSPTKLASMLDNPLIVDMFL